MAELSFEIPKTKKPICFIFAEDTVGLSSSIRHHSKLGFGAIYLVKSEDIDLPKDCEKLCSVIDVSGMSFSDASPFINRIIEKMPDKWIYYCFNAEYLHFPFCEYRSIADLTDFITEEKRDSIFTYVIDLYAENIDMAENGFSLETAHFDDVGYYSAQRFADGEALERQFDIFGGLKWRFEEHLPYERRKLNRVSLFKAKPGLQMDKMGYFNDPEYNTISCPWHNNMTMAICSFRTAKGLKTNPGSTFEIENFMWSKSVKFHWNSQQLMDHGFMEPGQWF